MGFARWGYHVSSAGILLYAWMGRLIISLIPAFLCSEIVISVSRLQQLRQSDHNISLSQTQANYQYIPGPIYDNMLMQS